MNPDVEWSTREKLAIASYVLHTGDQHWSGGVSRMLRPLGEPDRPLDWFSSKNCAQQYTALLEAAETPRRKRGERTESTESSSSTSSQHPPSVHEAMVRKLTQERVEELRKLIRIERTRYRKLKQTVEQIEAGELDHKLDDMVADIKRQSGNIKYEPSTSTASPATSIDASHPHIILKIKTKSDSPPEKAQSMSIDVNIPTNTGESERPQPEETQTVAQPTLNVTADEESMDATGDVMEEESTPQELDKDNEDDSSYFPTPSTPQTIPSSIDKEETTSSIASSSRTLPTPTPVIESDSCDEDEEETQSMIIPLPSNDNVDEINATVDTALDKMDLSNDNSLQCIKDNQNVIINEETLLPCSIPELPVKSDDTHVDKSEVESNDNAADQICAKIISADDNKTSQAIEALPGDGTDIDKDTADAKEGPPFQEEDVQPETNPEDELAEEEHSVFVNPSTSGEADIKAKDEDSYIDEDNISHRSVSITDEYADNDRLDDSSFGYPASMPSTPAYVDSFPSSPALSSTSDVDPEATANSRAWKKSIMILWKQVASHRYASLFLQPVTDDIAPNYSNIVYRPMDLATLKKNLENGLVRTTSDFQRDLMLMFENALMYNSHEHDVYKMTQEMQKDVMEEVAQFLATQLMMETTKQTTPKGLRRSTLRKSVMSEKVSEARSKRTAAIEGEMKFMKKKSHE